MLLSETSRFLPHVGDLGIWTNGAYVIGHPAPGNGTCSPDDPSTQNTREVINGFHMGLKRGHAAAASRHRKCAARTPAVSGSTSRSSAPIPPSA